jgi:hypothetical protein
MDPLITDNYMDQFVMIHDDGYATGSIIIPPDAEVFRDEFDDKSNIHFVMFKFWDAYNTMMQHCLYEIDYNNFQVRSYIKDHAFEWMESSNQKLSFY